MLPDRGGPGKFRRPPAPAARAVVQADVDTATLHSILVAEVTSNLAMAADPACLFLDTTTPEGQATGVLMDAVASCRLLATVRADAVDRVIGTLSDALKLRLNDCLKATLDLP